MIPKNYIHLHLHTEYSIVDGIVRVKSLPEHVAQLGMPAVAMTDQMNIFAMVKFYQAALAQGIKPIIGADIQVQDQDKISSLVLLCKDRDGYRNLSILLSRAYQEGQSLGRPLVQKSWLFEYSKGLIVLSGGLSGEIAQALLSDQKPLAVSLLQEWQAHFPQHFYLEIQRVGRPKEEEYIQAAVVLSQKYQVPLLATNDVRFLKSEDYDAHEARVCIHAGVTLADEAREKKDTPAQYLKSPEEMAILFADLPEALENTVELGKRCNLELDFDHHFLPDYVVASEVTLEDYFVQEAKNGLINRLESLSDKTSEQEKRYHERLQMELEVIKTMHYAGYFLVVADFIRWAKLQDIPVGPGRGSGAGSLVAYALGITDIDPLQYDLLFERFLNPERVSMPDFDIDFCMEGRDRVIEYVAQKYGRENVSQIITYGTMAAKAVVRDVGRVLGHPYGFVDQLARLIPFKLGMTLQEALSCEELLEKRYQEEEEVKNLIDLGIKLEGIPRNAGKHAGGVVIAPKPLVEFLPLYCEEASTNWVSQFDKDDVEKLGLVKFDFLGLRTLTIIHWAVQRVNQRLVKEGKLGIKIEQIPLDDPETFALLKACQTTAVFQLESQGIKELIKRLQPDHFDEVVALVALYRPGPLQSGMVDDFIDRKHGRAEVTYFHPQLEPILKSTYGVILYQEQVMQIAQQLAGYTLGGADLLRRAMGKKKPEEMAQQREIFVAGAQENSIKEAVANKIFDLMEKFAGYGFNKSHSVGYALLSYQTAWLKAHYPAEFMSAVLSSDMNNTDKVVHFIEDSKQLGLTIMPPSIHHSDYLFQVDEKGDIVYGLGAIKGVGESAVENLVAERTKHGTFSDLFELCRRVDVRKINRKVLESLIYSGTLDPFEVSREVLISSIDSALRGAEQFSRNQAQGQVDLFADIGQQTQPVTAQYAKHVKSWTVEERLKGEKDTLGFYLSQHPIEPYAEELSCFTTALADIKPTKRGSTTWVAGFVMSLRFRVTQSGNRMAFLSLDDNTAKADVMVFSDQLTEYRPLLVKDTLLLIEGEVSPDDYTGGYRIVAKKVMTLDEARRQFARQLLLKLDMIPNAAQFTSELQAVLKPFCGGDCPVSIDFQQADSVTRLMLGAEWNVAISQALIEQLGVCYGKEKIRVGY